MFWVFEQIFEAKNMFQVLGDWMFEQAWDDGRKRRAILSFEHPAHVGQLGTCSLLRTHIRTPKERRIITTRQHMNIDRNTYIYISIYI